MKCQRLYHQPNSAVNHQPANLILMWSLSPAIYHQLMLLSLCGHYSSPNPPPFGSPFRSRFPALGITSYGNIIASNQTHWTPLSRAVPSGVESSQTVRWQLYLWILILWLSWLGSDSGKFIFIESCWRNWNENSDFFRFSCGVKDISSLQQRRWNVSWFQGLFHDRAFHLFWCDTAQIREEEVKQWVS